MDPVHGVPGYVLLDLESVELVAGSSSCRFSGFQSCTDDPASDRVALNGSRRNEADEN